MSSPWFDQEEEPHRRVSARLNSRRAGLLGPAGQFASLVTAECITGECSHRYSLRMGVKRQVRASRRHNQAELVFGRDRVRN